MADLLATANHLHGIIGIGGFYRRFDGEVVKTCGFGPGFVSWRTDGGHSSVSTPEELATWEWLESARDFPDAKDPELPSEFDLHYDTHTLSDLIREFGGLEAALKDKHIKAMCKTYNIDLRKPQTIRDYTEAIRVERQKKT